MLQKRCFGLYYVQLVMYYGKEEIECISLMICLVVSKHQFLHSSCINAGVTVVIYKTIFK